MAKVKVLVVKCDKCGFEEQDVSKFSHVVITNVAPLDSRGHKIQVISERDLCESCLGLPGVNRDA